jgi:hypothetical protein
VTNSSKKHTFFLSLVLANSEISYNLSQVLQINKIYNIHCVGVVVGMEYDNRIIL